MLILSLVNVDNIGSNHKMAMPKGAFLILILLQKYRMILYSVLKLTTSKNSYNGALC